MPMTMTYARFPARVRSSDGSVDVNRAAVVVIDGQAELAVQQKGGEFQAGTVHVLAVMDDVTVGQPDAGVTALTGAGGVVWEVSQGDGCGCRSPLLSHYQSRVSGQRMGT